MEELLFANSQLTTVSLVVCAVLAAVGVMFVVRMVLGVCSEAIRKGYGLRYRGATLIRMQQFEEMLEDARKAVRILSDYTTQYPQVFNEANWSKAVLYVEDLEAGYLELEKLIDTIEYKDAFCLLEFLCSDGKEIAPWKKSYIPEEWSHLYNWPSVVDEVINKVTTRLQVAAEKTKNIGIDRGRIRRPTLLALQDIKKKLALE